MTRCKMHDRQMEDNVDVFLQVELIKEKLPFVKCIQKNGALYATFSLSNKFWKNTYAFELAYIPSERLAPVVWVTNPDVPDLPDVHVNKNKTLCLFTPVEYPPWKRFSMADEIIPWTYKWALFYERWLINGNIWPGSETAHGVCLISDYSSSTPCSPFLLQ